MRRSLLIVLLALLTGTCLQVRATTQMPASFLIKTNGNWQLWGNYLNGYSIVIENTERATNVVIGVRSLLPEAELDRVMSTAGPLWGEYCLWYFIELGGRKMFRVRSQYGTSILIDLEEARAAPAQDFTQQLREADRREIIALLQQASRSTSAKHPEWTDRSKAAILFAATDRLADCVPYLRKIESDSKVTAGVLTPGNPGSFSDQKQINRKNSLYWSYTEYGIRRLASLALRRLGQAPFGYPAIGILPSDKTHPVSAETRRTKVAQLQIGQTPPQVYHLLGPPEYIESARREENGKVTPRTGAWSYAWRYDIDGPEPFSLLVIWDDTEKLGKVERITPPLWHGDSLVANDAVKPVFNPDGSIGRGMQLYEKTFRGQVVTIVAADALSGEAVGTEKEKSWTNAIRVQNLTGHDFAHVSVNTNQFGSVKSDATTGYQPVQSVFEHATVMTREADGYMRNDRFIGGQNPQLDAGHYTYVLKLKADNSIMVTLQKD